MTLSVADKMNAGLMGPGHVAALEGAMPAAGGKYAGPVQGSFANVTDAAATVIDFSKAQNFEWAMAGSRTLGQPIGLTAGQAGILYVTLGAANADITGLHATYKPGLLVAFTIAGPPGAVWRIPYTIRNSQWVSLGVPMREA